MKRLERVGHIVTVGVFWAIVLGLAIDVSKQQMGQPLIYNAEIAQAEELQPEEVLIEKKIEWTKERIREEVDTKALEYGGNSDRIWRVLMCESGASTTIQSYHKRTYPKSVKTYGDPNREQSFGLPQIHLPDHPDVTYEQAIDPEFAIDYLAKHLTKGTDKWSCK